MNKHNHRYWAAENSHWLREIPCQHQWKLNVWCGIVGNHIIDPHFLMPLSMDLDMQTS